MSSIVMKMMFDKLEKEHPVIKKDSCINVIHKKNKINIVTNGDNFRFGTVLFVAKRMGKLFVLCNVYNDDIIGYIENNQKQI